MEQSVYDAQRVRGVLSSGKALLFDGATGTYARELPGFPEGAVELCCLSAPDRVLALHQAYLAAGCQAIKTNTFAAHVSLAVENGDQQRAVIHAACSLARQAVTQRQAAVFADIGPAPVQEDAARCYTDMAQAFLDEGITCFLMETMHSAQGLYEAAATIRARCPEAFIAVSFAADADGFTRAGEVVAGLIARMDACEDVDAVGLNCICGAYHMRRLLEGMARPKKRLIAMPNAGYPHVENGRTYYDSDPAYFARQVAQCRDAGAAILGGCCGTTPEHIRRVAVQLALAASGTPVRRSPWGTIAIIALASCVFSLIVCMLLRGKMKSVRMARQANAYVSGELNVTASRDQYTHTTETRTKIEHESSSGGGSHTESGGGGSGRSGSF